MSSSVSRATELGVAESEQAKPQRSFTSNTATILSAQLGRIALSGLLEVLYARLLGPFGRGQMSLCIMVESFYLLAGGLGGEVPLILWSADSKKKPAEWLPSVLLCGLGGTLLAEVCWAAVFFGWHPTFLQGINNTLALLLGVSFPLTILASYSNSLLLGLDRIRERSFLIVSNQAITLLAAVVLLMVAATAETAMLAVVIGLIAVVVIAAVFLRNYLKAMRGWSPSVALKNVGQALHLGIRGQLGNVATFLNYRLDVFVVNYYLGPKEVGLYSLGVLISEVIWQAPNAAAASTLSRTARNLDKGSPEFSCLVCRQVFVFACLSAVVLGLLSTWLVPVVFGARFRPSIPVIWWILPGTVAFAAGKVMTAELLGRGWPHYNSIFAVATLVLTIALDLWLVPQIGIQGAAIASSIAYFFNALLAGLVLRRKLSVSWRAMLVPSLAELAMYKQLWNRLIAWLHPSCAA
jgi:O-antigen/teichoic acid export membrane protein